MTFTNRTKSFIFILLPMLFIGVGCSGGGRQTMTPPETGNIATGEACTTYSECQSGICADGICASSPSQNAGASQGVDSGPALWNAMKWNQDKWN